jgi:23S rRNA (pseudouridine1915-N3)-methyltransferase
LKITFLSVGKTHEKYIDEGVGLFTKRISHYHKVEWKLLTPSKQSDPHTIKKEEAATILKFLQNDDVLVLLDERGKNLSSPDLANLIQQKANQSTQHLVFLIGGAYGVHEEIMKRAQFSWSLSKLVFPHMLVRLILSEQIYRACSINANEKYHHE